MKKTLSLILAVVMCLSLCACGGGNANTPAKVENTPTEVDTTAFSDFDCTEDSMAGTKVYTVKSNEEFPIVKDVEFDPNENFTMKYNINEENDLFITCQVNYDENAAVPYTMSVGLMYFGLENMESDDLYTFILKTENTRATFDFKNRANTFYKKFVEKKTEEYLDSSATAVRFGVGDTMLATLADIKENPDAEVQIRFTDRDNKACNDVVLEKEHIDFLINIYDLCMTAHLDIQDLTAVQEGPLK